MEYNRAHRYATLSVIVGAASVVLFIAMILAPIAIALGRWAMVIGDAEAASFSTRRRARLGIALGAIGLVLTVIWYVVRKL